MIPEIPPLSTALGMPDSPEWALIGTNTYIPAGVHIAVQWVAPTGEVLGGFWKTAESPCWAPRPPQGNPDSPTTLLWVAMDHRERCALFQLPLTAPGTYVRVACTDGSVGLLLWGEHGHYAPYTSGSHCLEGAVYQCDRGKEMLRWFREEVLWWQGAATAIYNPALIGDK